MDREESSSSFFPVALPAAAAIRCRHVIPIPGRLIYRGVDINEIVNEAYRNDRFVFEEVIWLLLFGSLPTQEQLDDFCELLAKDQSHH